jgi:hypothetical protein
MRYEIPIYRKPLAKALKRREYKPLDIAFSKGLKYIQDRLEAN